MRELPATPMADAKMQLLAAIDAAIKEDDHDAVSRLDQALRELESLDESPPKRARLRLRIPGQ